MVTPIVLPLLSYYAIISMKYEGKDYLAQPL